MAYKQYSSTILSHLLHFAKALLLKFSIANS